MIVFVRGALILTVAFLAMLALLTWITFSALTFIMPAHAMSCARLKQAVEKYGLDAVKVEARQRGWTDQQIEAEQRRWACSAHLK